MKILQAARKSETELATAESEASCSTAEEDVEFTKIDEVQSKLETWVYLNVKRILHVI